MLLLLPLSLVMSLLVGIYSVDYDPGRVLEGTLSSIGRTGMEVCVDREN